MNNEIGNVSIFTGRPLKKELRVLFMSPFETSQLHIFLFKDSQPSTGPPTTCARSETPTTIQVTSTFVEKALKLAQPDIDLLVVEQQLRDFEDTQMLAQLFADMLQIDDEGEHKVG